MNKHQTIFAFITALVLSLTTTTSVAAVNLSCDSYGDNDALLWARYIDTGERQTFDVTVKLPNAKESVTELTRPVFVGTENIGSIALSKDRNTGKGGLSLNANTAYSSPGNLPANWPGASVGTLIRVGNLSCALKG